MLTESVTISASISTSTSELGEPLSLAEADKSSEELEQAWRQEFSSRVTIAVHLEPRSDKPKSNEGNSPPLEMLARHFQNYLKRKTEVFGTLFDDHSIVLHFSPEAKSDAPRLKITKTRPCSKSARHSKETNPCRRNPSLEPFRPSDLLRCGRSSRPRLLLPNWIAVHVGQQPSVSCRLC